MRRGRGVGPADRAPHPAPPYRGVRGVRGSTVGGAHTAHARSCAVPCAVPDCADRGGCRGGSWRPLSPTIAVVAVIGGGGGWRPVAGPSGAGLAPVELAIRTAMTRLGASLLQQLLAADTGHRGPRMDCGAGHSAVFVGHRDKNLDTVLGRITLRRAYYHCAVCGCGIVPRDDDLGVTDASLSPGLRRMVARAGAAEPFATAADLLAELAGIRLTGKRIERSADADGAAAAKRISAESAAIARGTVGVLPAPADRSTPPDKLYIAIDGTGVPMVPAATTGRAGKTGDGRGHCQVGDWCGRSG